MPQRYWVGVAAAATGASTLALLMLILRGSQLSVADGVTIDSGGRVALIGLLVAGLGAALIRRIDLRIPRWFPLAVAAISFLLTATLWGLVALGLDSTAWAAYGGLQVLRAAVNFNDLDWDMQWLDCGLCDHWNPHYGPALAWGKPLTAGLLGTNWVGILGFAMAIAMLLGLVWLMRRSTPRGALVLGIAAIGPAWLLQQDRANLDGLVFLAIVAGGWFVSRRESLFAWSLFATLIWVNGALKYYPFAVGIALLPALRLRRGWMVITGFLLASASFMLVFWQDFMDSLKWNGESILVTFDFPAYGRLMVLSRMGPLGSESGPLNIGNILFACLAVSALAWGVVWGLRLRHSSPVLPAMALGGGTVFLSAVLIGGFGFMYKGVFLLPLVPLIALPLRGWSRIGPMTLGTSLFALICVVYAMTFAYASVLTTLAGILASCIGVGAGLAISWRLIREHRGAPDHARARATQASIAAS